MGQLGEHARRVHGGHPGQRGAGACEEQSGRHGLVFQAERTLYLIVGYPRLASIHLSFNTGILHQPNRKIGQAIPHRKAFACVWSSAADVGKPRMLCECEITVQAYGARVSLAMSAGLMQQSPGSKRT